MPRFGHAMTVDEFNTLVIEICKRVCIGELSDEFVALESPYDVLAYKDLDESLHRLFDSDDGVTVRIKKDLEHIFFDWENSGTDIPGMETSNLGGYHQTSDGIPYLVCYAGGDWEDPVYFVLYPDTPVSIRAFIPEDGNTYDPNAKIAFGNDVPDDDNYGNGEDWENPRKVERDLFLSAINVHIKPRS